MRRSVLGLQGYAVWDFLPEPWAYVSPELFQTPVLSSVLPPFFQEGRPLVLRCQTKLHPQKLALWSFYSFYKDGHAIQNRSHNPILHISEIKEADSGLYQCAVDTKDGLIQKRSQRLEIQVQVPVSHPAVTLRHEATNPAAGDTVEFLCEVQSGSLPILCSFYLDGEILGDSLASAGRVAALLISVKPEWSARNYSCEAKNNVSRERSEPRKFPLVGSQVLSAISNRSIAWLLASLLCGIVLATVFLIHFFRPCKKDGKGTSQEMKEDECRLSEPNVSPPTARPKELTTEVQDNHIYATVNKPAKRQPLSEITTNDLDPNSMKSQ
ncbi:Fc receptor-like protein 6 [Mesocricetus auratus]|uniref:Fc receptor-like protein 6 n=1 Tax=Mesocricetus auratus TaxID=10036 RepID=A0A3Q0D4F5_MESAU|nr:Fc receptor-like protein 6 [Mesocricetus auratus]